MEREVYSPSGQPSSGASLTQVKPAPAPRSIIPFSPYSLPSLILVCHRWHAVATPFLSLHTKVSFRSSSAALLLLATVRPARYDYSVQQQFNSAFPLPTPASFFSDCFISRFFHSARIPSLNILLLASLAPFNVLTGAWGHAPRPRFIQDLALFPSGVTVGA